MCVVAAWTFWLACVSGLAAGDPPQESPCVNFARVGEGFYRGEEPDQRCLKHLAGLGIRTVVSLGDEAGASELERAKVVALGLRHR